MGFYVILPLVTTKGKKMKPMKRLKASMDAFSRRQEEERLRRSARLESLAASGFRWGFRIATKTWNTSYEEAVSLRLKMARCRAARCLPDNSAPAEFPVVAGQHPLGADGQIQLNWTTGSRAFNRANVKAAAFDSGARRGFATGLAEQAATLAVDIGAYKALAAMPYWHGFAKAVASRVARLGLAKFVAVETLPTEFVDWAIGGTYRHRCRITFDRPVEVELKDGGHYRPGIVGELFGRGSSSKSQVAQVAPEVLEIFQDQ